MDATPQTEVNSPSLSRWRHFALVLGPGVVVMLADTDAGSIITAAQSGAESGHRLSMLGNFRSSPPCHLKSSPRAPWERKGSC
jgi:hypothetical protein